MRYSLTIFQLLMTLLAGVAALETTAFSAGVPQKLPTDVLQLGKYGSAADKQFVFDFGLGASNPFLSGSSSTLKYSKNLFQFGDGLSSSKQFIANLGLGANNPKMQFNPSTSSWEFSNDGTNFTAVGTGSGGAAVESLQNPGFESGIVQGWSNTGGTFAAATSGANLLVGRGSATFTATASSQSFQSASIPIPNGLLGASCGASIMYKFGDGTLSFEVTNGSSTILAGPVVLQASAAAKVVPLIFPCPPSGNYQLKVVSSGAGALYAFDQGHLGSADLIQVSQSGVFGYVQYDLGCAWGMSGSSSFQQMTDGGACTSVVHGGLSNPSPTNLGFTLNNAPSGDYDISVRGTIYASSSGHTNTACAFNAYDTTLAIAAPAVLVGVIPTASGNPEAIVPMMNFHLSYPQAGNHVIEIHGASHDGYEACNVAAADGSVGVEILVTYHPGAAQIVGQATGQAATWSGYVTTSSSGWSTTNTGSQADLTASGTTSVVQGTNRNFGSVTPAASSQAGVIIQALAGHEYEISFNTDAQQASGGGANLHYYLVAGSTTIDNIVSFSDQPIPMMLKGHWISPSTAAAQIWVQGNVSSGTGRYAYGGNQVQINITDITQPGPTLVLPGNVSSASSGQEVIGRAHVTLTIGGPYSLVKANPGFTTTPNGANLTSPGTGGFNIAFPAGEWSDDPVCICNPAYGAVAGVACYVSSLPSTSGVTFQAVNSGSGAATEGWDAEIICMGPK